MDRTTRGSIRHRRRERFSKDMKDQGYGMGRFCEVVLVALIGVSLMLGGCSSESESEANQRSAGADIVADEGKPAVKLSKIERELLAIDALTDGGDVDKAAAGLVRMRMKGAQFSSDEAAAYRDSLSIAYDKALELADDGNAKGKAAMKILQSNGAF
jgi:hypothetical protein